ncbi:putative mitochondrial saccharopine dehydrogenase-like oxidoreductase [Capsicum annuum]|uniref:Mitochondrial saccharopine dehydrogenase-like oxidoreductase n=1 Tax=Capsicum annuum TaxID=4072 RepID=A0A2G3ACF7_CAPAN|nr:probable mitochondrial saccharopine dehydrogenase-like oxidoreductase At5g39410 [Capsicum annuum]XP_047263480.1 probable mitochondrial saccharopine dehydrogenase-like oxidoreductase At5g39410 [Capsicum annuum]PHT91917.1 putative mitochondrial saccharopine dehydrogenase-like oxidoreductase [Capsicum annuum]
MWTINATYKSNRTILPKILDHFGYYPTCYTIITNRAMSQKLSPNPTYDVIILGASGFTGKHVIREALKFLNVSSSPLKNLAIAGRNASRLSRALQWASGPNPPPEIPIIAADTNDPSSLRHLASRTKIILNCVGPFRLYGEPVVEACVDSGCDYLDICGEPEFMERMEVKYHDKAVENGSLVVSACGFDSVPAELGWMFSSRQWTPPAICSTIEAYISLESDKRIVGNLGTYESAVLSVANADKLQELRRSRPKKPRPVILGTSSKGPMINHLKEVGLWAVKLPSADATVVRRTLSCLAENLHGLPGVNESTEQIERREEFWSTIKPAHFGMKIASKYLLGVVRFITVGKFIALFGKTGIGRWLLLNFPSVFSLGFFRKKGPTEDEVASATFKMWFVGHGFTDGSLASQGNRKPDMQIITRVMGPEIGYLTTPSILVQCALILLKERDSLPKGGVFPPGIVFGPTDLQDRLQKNGISFDVISKKTV